MEKLVFTRALQYCRSAKIRLVVAACNNKGYGPHLQYWVKSYERVKAAIAAIYCPPAAKPIDHNFRTAFNPTVFLEH
jgi:hypothetical protein